MYVFACVLDGFYAAVASQGSDGPLAVHRNKRILDANPEARTRGVFVGMPLSEARSILAMDGRFVEWEEETYREASRSWMEVVAEHSDVVEPLRQHEALADLSGHPQPREAAERLGRKLQNLGSNPRCGLGTCRWVARLAARHGDPLGLAQADPRSYVAGVPLARLPLVPEDARRLGLLGYRTAEDVAGIPLDTLRAQFGERAHGIARAATGKGDAQVRALFPQNSVAFRFSFEGPPESRSALDAGLTVLARKIGTALRELDGTGRTVELFLEGEYAAVTRLSRTFARPLANEVDVANALGLMLPDAPLTRVLSVRARLPGVERARRVQLDLHGGRSRADSAESVRASLGHVREAYGESAVRLLSEIREPRWVRLRRAYRELNGWAW